MHTYTKVISKENQRIYLYPILRINFANSLYKCPFQCMMQNLLVTTTLHTVVSFQLQSLDCLFSSEFEWVLSTVLREYRKVPG